MISKDTKNIVLMTLITVLVWLLYEIYNIQTTTVLPPEYEAVLTPFSSDLNTDLIQSLPQRINY